MDLINSLTECLDKIKLLDYHYSCANLQRKSYIEAKKNLKDDEILIEFDFKQKIKIGLSPRQVSSEFYRDKSRYVLGIGIYYRKNSKVECLNVNIISDNLGQKSYSVISALR